MSAERAPAEDLAAALAAQQAHNQRLLALTQLVTSLSALPDPARMVDQISAGLLEVLSVDAVLFWLYNTAAQRYVLSAVASRLADPVPEEEREALAALMIRSGESLAGQAVGEASGRWAGDPESYRAAFGSMGKRREGLFHRLRLLLPEEFAVLALPLRIVGKTLAVVEIVGPAVAEQDREWLQLYIDQLAALFSLARMQAETARQRRRLRAMDAVVTAITAAADLPELLQASLLVVMGIVGAARGAICLIAPGEQQMHLLAQHALPAHEAALLSSPQAIATLEDVIYYGQPILRMLAHDGEPPEGEEGLGRAAVPLLAGGTIVGVLLLYEQYPALHAAVDWSSLMSIGSQIGIAIANLRLYEESQRERRRLNTVIASMADGVAICNGRGELILTNEAAATMLGPGALPLALQIEHVQTLEGNPVDASQMPLARALAGEVFRDYQLALRGPEERDIVVSFSGAPLRGTALSPEPDVHDGAVVVFRDITVQHRLDEAKDEFLAVAAHELRSPLAAIKGYSDLMLRREQRSGTEERNLRGHQILNQQVNILVNLVDNLLDVSRIDAGRMLLQLDKVDLGALIEAVATQVRSSALNHTVVVDLPLAAIYVLADGLRLRQVVTNLLTNAVRYSPVETTVRVAVERSGESGLLLVDDEGPGVPPAHRERLFERYYRVPGIKRTGSSTEGLGLGLYLCREIVALHHGRIWVESAPGGGGARFVVELPLFTDADAAIYDWPEQQTFELGAASPARPNSIDD